jgi:hypothetical protein
VPARGAEAVAFVPLPPGAAQPTNSDMANANTPACSGASARAWVLMFKMTVLCVENGWLRLPLTAAS